MAKTIFTTITPLPPNISRQTVLETLHDHREMIDLNPSHVERSPTKPPASATPEEYHCQWYRIVDKVSYLPANLYTGTRNGRLEGNMPGEPALPREIGINAPVEGLYIREDVEMKCNILMTRFVRKTLQECLKALVARLVVKAQLQEARERNMRLKAGNSAGFEREGDGTTPPVSPPMRSPGVSSPTIDPIQPEKWAEAEKQGHPALRPYTPLQMQQQHHHQQQLYQTHHDRKSYGGQDQRWSGISDKTQTSLPGANYMNKPANYPNKPARIAEMEAPPGPVELP
ncbi:hypothetical protein EYC84_004333 [Monilinia fructicola]|uniref:DUF7053 domain-containing protein n=1 Tax=Monilinia fructicola TaxID=38448 RepID=A0A5M9K515_MONFR|nr:hypothetical protein EYC84_004333 [Monilinia fructicola]